MTSRRSVLQSRPFFLAHTQFAQCVDPVHQTHKTFVSIFFEEGRRVFDRSNAASLAQLMATPDRPGSLFNLFRCCVQFLYFLNGCDDRTDFLKQPI